MNQASPQFPIGLLNIPEIITQVDLDQAINTLSIFPEQLKELTIHLTSEQLSKPYREGSWTIQQLIHHIADSHHHCYNRVRWTLTENSPVIKAYDQDAYATMIDYKLAPVDWSLVHIEVLHHKLVYIFEGLTETQWKGHFVHPETNATVNLKELALTYAWHSKHHLKHIKNAI